MTGTSILAGIAEVGNILGIDILNPLASDWMILDAHSSAAIIVPDTVPRFEFRGERRVSDYPVEKGAFASYNKVQQPYEIRMVMVCSGLNYVQSAVNAIGLDIGKDYMRKSDFIDTLDYMLNTTDLFTIVTPDKTYENANVEHYDYKRETHNGATMLIVEVWLREIRIAASAAYTNSNSPSAADPVSLGTVHPGDTVTVSFPNQSPIQ
jgi:hypothetical protein